MLCGQLSAQRCGACVETAFAPAAPCASAYESSARCSPRSPARRARRGAVAALALSTALTAPGAFPAPVSATELRGPAAVATEAVHRRPRGAARPVVAAAPAVQTTRDPFRDPFRNKKRPLVTYHIGRDAEREMLWRMCVAIACGAIIGMERRAAAASAGVRTLALVSLGAAVFTLTSLLSVSGNSSRMGAAISTGIGFLGAGAINHGGTKRHLVTAASVWIAAALGVAAASGLKFLALIASLVTVWILRWGVFLRYMRIVLKRKLPAFILQLKSSLRSQRTP